MLNEERELLERVKSLQLMLEAAQREIESLKVQRDVAVKLAARWPAPKRS